MRGTVHVLTEKVVATLDKCKLSYRNSTRIVTAVAEALGIDVQSLIITKTAMYDARRKIREKESERIKTLFKNEKIDRPMIVHWDGKIMPDSVECQKQDRMPIIITYGKNSKILNVPALPNGKGETQADYIYKALKDWGLLDSVQILCCDTTNSNLGRIKGAAVLLEQKLERDLLYLPCRHHILEIVLSGVFSIKFNKKTGPEVDFFLKFKKDWPNINQKDYKTGFEDRIVDDYLRSKIKDIDDFTKNLLDSQLPRDDYKEFLNLARIFLGLVPTRDVKFRKPIGCSHARWMSKAIYSILMYLFRDSYPLF